MTLAPTQSAPALRSSINGRVEGASQSIPMPPLFFPMEDAGQSIPLPPVFFPMEDGI